MSHHWNRLRGFLSGSLALAAFLLLTGCGVVAPTPLKQTATPTVSTSPTLTPTATATPTPRPALGTISEFALPSDCGAYFRGCAPVGITSGPDGNLWYTEGNRIGRITPEGHILTQFVLPTDYSSPGGITTGPDGNLWFTDASGNQIGRITPEGRITEHPRQRP